MRHHVPASPSHPARTPRRNQRVEAQREIAAERREEESPDRAPRVLVVEDHEDTRQIIGEALWVAGYHVALAADGIEALAKVWETSPDLVLLDLRLPRASGATVLRELRGEARTRQLEVICFTAYGENELTDEVRRLGCREVITKPADPRSLVDAVRAAVGPATPRDPETSPWRGGHPSREETLAELERRLDEIDQSWRRWRPRTLATPPSVLTRRLMASAVAHGLDHVAERARQLYATLDAVEDTWGPARRVIIAVAVAELRAALLEAKVAAPTTTAPS